jgi:hypothetical protein
MPIISYFAVVGAALVALLFVADANMESRPLAFTSNFDGLPKPWTPELNPPLPQGKPQAIRTAAAPQAEEAEPAAVAAAPEPVAAPIQQVAKVEAAPKKPKHVARKQQARRDVPGARYAWRPDSSPLGGGPWRF